MKKLLSLCFMSLLFVFTDVNAVSIFTINGDVNDEKGNGITRVNVDVNGVKFTSDKSGHFTIKVKRADIYQIKFSKKGFYSNIQTFSHYELSQINKLDGDIDTITLVKRAKSRVMLAFGGDVMMGRRYYSPYFGDEILIHENSRLSDSQSIVKHVKPYMSLADFSAVNLETQIADKKPSERAPKSVTFYSQPETLAALKWAGVDYVTLGNNHTYDYLDSGLSSTLSYLQQSGLGFSGAGINQEDALGAYQENLNGVPFAMLGYVGWEGNFTPTQTASQDKGGAAYGSLANIVSSVKNEVEKGAAAIVQYHGSQEYANGPTNVTEHRLKAALDAGASLAIAHHPHVAQGLELYNDKLIAYSMGNFIFDQFFSATPHSFILYVWLDEGQFHRAEIVPIYLKGYQPTPATGMHRYTILKRLSVLSAERKTIISRSGGHGVIVKNDLEKSNNHKFQRFNLPIKDKEHSLYHMPWDASLVNVELSHKESKYRLGTNLINGSDFEGYDTFAIRERGWIYDDTKSLYHADSYSGSKSLAVKIPEKSMSVVGMQTFRRVYNASSPMTVSAKIKTSKPVKAKIYWQGRKKRQKLFEALEQGEKHLIAELDITNNDEWQNMSADFNSPRVGYRSFRVFVEFEHQLPSAPQVLIDDFSLIEWQTPFSNKPPLLISVDDKQVSYIGFEKPYQGSVTLTYH